MVTPLITFDYSALSAFYTSGASLSTGLRTAVLRNQLADTLALAEQKVVPPWQLPPAPEVKSLEQRVFSNAPLIDPDDPLFDRTDLDDDSKTLFAAFKAINVLSEIVSYAQTSEGKIKSTLVDSKFQARVAELKAFINNASTNTISLVTGILEAELDSAIVLSQVEDAPRFNGAVILENRDDPIPGLNTTDEFTIQADDGTTVRTVTITMSDISADTNDYTLDNISAHVNQELIDAGISTQLHTERYGENEYGFRIDVGFGETATLSANAATDASAVYFAGYRGLGPSGSGFIGKLDDLGGADPAETFYHQIETTDQADNATSVAVDSAGSVYVVGRTAGDLGSQAVDPDNNDAFLQKYDAAGNLIFTQRLGATEDGGAFAVAVDGDDNVIVTGQVRGNLTATSFGGNLDTFVTKYDSSGQEQWTRQAGPFLDDIGVSIAVNSSNEIFVAGLTRSAINTSSTYNGGSDAFFTKIDAAGNALYSKQFGDAGNESVTGIAVDNSGNIYVVGDDDGNGYLRQYADTANDDPPLTTLDLGALGTGGSVTGVEINATGQIFISGLSTNVALSGTIANAHSGGLDAFVLRVSISSQETASDSVAITVNAVNDGPTTTNPGTQTTAIDNPVTVNGLTIADVDVGASDLEVTLTVANGDVTLANTAGLTFTTGNGTADATMTFTGTATDINNAIDGLSYQPGTSFNGVDNLDITVDDQGATGSGGAQQANDQVRIEVGAINTAPVFTVPGDQQTENISNLTISGISIADTDVGGDNLEVTISVDQDGTITLNGTTGLTFSVGDGIADNNMTFQGSLADINSALDDLTFLPQTGAEDLSTVTFQVNDLGNNGAGGALTDNKTLQVHVYDQTNDQPTINAPGGTTKFDEDTALTFTNISIDDPDSGLDDLEVTLGVSNGLISLSQTSGLAFTSGDGTDDATMTFRGSKADINSALNGLRYDTPQDFVGTDTLTIDVSDLGNKGLGGVQTRSDTVNIEAEEINDPPVVVNPGPQSTSQDVFLAINGLSFTDVELPVDKEGELTLSVSNGTLTLADTTGLSFSTGDGIADATMTFRGTLADINAAVDGLIYQPNTSFSGLDSLNILIDDRGQGAGPSATTNDSIAISVLDATNDAPVINNPGAQSVDEDTDLVITTLSVTDVDSGDQEIETTLAVSQGVLTLAQTTGLTFTTGDGTQDTTMTFRGTATDVNNALNGLIYRGNQDYNGGDTLSIDVNDLGNAGSGGTGGTPAVDFVSYVGTANVDGGFGVALDPSNGDIYLSGETAGTLAGETSSGLTDGFVAKLDSSGNLAWTHQFGGGYDQRGSAIAFDADGTNILSRFGLPEGQVPPDVNDDVATVSTARAGQYFYVSVDNGPLKQVEIGDGDSFGFLSFRIRQAIGTEGGSATFIDDDIAGRFLRVSAAAGHKIELIAGPEGLDALSGIGLQPKVLFGEIEDDGSEDFVQTTFGLGLTDDINLLSDTSIQDAQTLLEFAEVTVQKAYRLKTQGPDPEFEFPEQPPQRILDQIGEMQAALARLQSVTANANAGANLLASGQGNLFNFVL